MSTLSSVLDLGNVGVAYLLEGSFDLFVTVNCAYSTHDGLFGAATAYDQRIVEIGDLQRGFGVDGTLAASSVAVRLANLDAGCDFLITSPTILFQIRWRLKIVLFNPADPTDYAIKTLGVFVNLDNPVRDGKSVLLNLADDSFGQAAELAIPPTGSEAFNNALDSTSTEPPCPIAMGGGFVPAIPRPYEFTDTTVNYVICATTDTAAVVSTEVETLTITGPGLNYGLGQPPLIIQKTETYRDSTGAFLVSNLWGVAKTASLTKDGRTWKVLYVTLYVENLKTWLSSRGYLARTTVTSGPFIVDVDVGLTYFNQTVLPGLAITAFGRILSSRTYSGTGASTVIHAADIVYDLLRHYSRGLTAGQANQASFTAASAAFPLYLFRASYYFSNFIQDVTRVTSGNPGGLARNINRGVASVAQGQLRKAIGELCQGGLIDVVTDWDGQFVAFVLANNFALQTTTPTVIDETLWKNPTDKVPSAGERWAPYNRVILAASGRIIDNATAITEWGVVLARTINDSTVLIEVAATGADFGIGTFGGLGVLESKVRPVMSFEYPLEALAWELGELIAVTWSRGETALGPWASTVFRVEEMVLHPARCSVSVKAVYIDDLTHQLPYLLDDETLLVRAKNAGTSGFQVLDGSTACNLFGGADNFITMGVQAGDIVVLRDTTQAADVFTRNRAIRIASVFDLDTVVLATADLDFSFPGSGVVAAADWSIVRGATTYPTAVSDPTNYPSGGSMYGKQAEASTFSGGATANVMQAG